MVRPFARLLAVLLASGLAMSALSAHAADAGSLACIQAAEEGQAARDRGELLRASEILAACTSDGCPGIIRRDCTTWLEEVRARIPSVVVVARDSSGRDAPSATLTVDGAPKPMDGAPIELDPGMHIVRVQGGEVAAEERVVVSAGEKQRVISIALVPPPSPAALRARQDGFDASTARPRVPPGSYALGAFGVAGLATFGIFGFMGMSDANHLRTTCAPGCPSSDVEAARTKLVVADVALGVGLVSLSAATWFAVRGLSTRGKTGVADLVDAFAHGPPSLLNIVF